MVEPSGPQGADLAPLSPRRPRRLGVAVGGVAAALGLVLLVTLTRGPVESPEPVEVTEVEAVRAEREVPYLIPESDDPVLSLDVWAPERSARGQGDSPLVVLYPPRAFLERSLTVTDMARQLAATGAVVVVPEPARAPRNPGASPSPGEVLAGLTGDATCAAQVAAARAADYGADPERLVLVGASEGALAAASTVFRQVPPSPGCVAPREEPVVAQHLVLHEAQWVLGEPFDLTLRADGTAYDRVAIWSAVPGAPPQDVTLLLDSTTVRPERLDPGLRPLPAPAAASAERHGIWRDDEVTIRESNVVLLDVLDAGGHDVRVVEYAGDWRRYGPATASAVTEVVRNVTD